VYVMDEGKSASGVVDVAALGFLLMSRYFLQEDAKRRTMVAIDRTNVFFIFVSH
jgi:hypothetical protein